MFIRDIFKSTFFYAHLLNIYLLLKAFYFFPSGQVQIADVLICCSMLFYLLSTPIRFLYLLKEHKYILGFLGVVVLVNSLYSFFDESKSSMGSYIYPTIFFGFNIFIFIFCSELFKKYSYKNFLYLVFTTLLILVLLSLMLIYGFDKGIENDFRGRVYLMFNNPNQLAYYCLLIMTTVTIVQNRIGLHYAIVASIMSISFVLILSTRTRPTILGGVFLILISIYYGKNRLKASLLVLFAVLFLTALTQDGVFESKVLAERFTRLATQDNNTAIARGYARLLESPKYLIYGAGEGNYNRFANLDRSRPQEIHSGFLSLWFCYGLAGAMFFMLFLRKHFFKINRKDLLLLAPIFFYNFFHNGFRFSVFWIVLALCFVSTKKNLENVTT